MHLYNEKKPTGLLTSGIIPIAWHVWAGEHDGGSIREGDSKASWSDRDMGLWDEGMLLASKDLGKKNTKKRWTSAITLKTWWEHSIYHCNLQPVTPHLREQERD